MKTVALDQVVLNFINAANAYDTAAVTSLFTPDAVINDSSVGESFEGTAGVAKYFTTYFIGYNTRTELVNTECRASDHIMAKVDFTGDFGHEIGILEIRIDSSFLITFINAWLE